MNRAYSILEVKSYDTEHRTIEGYATTPSPDRMGDIVDPMGAKFSLPMPLLWQHDAQHPVGHVTLAQAGKNGIKFRATIAKIEEDGDLKRMCDKAWQAVKARLVRGVSIGFKPVKETMERLKSGGLNFKTWEWLELSLVTIPANADCTISLIKSLSTNEMRAASGHDRMNTAPGVPGHKDGQFGNDGIRCSSGIERQRKMLNLDQQISNLENSRAAKAARMEAIASKSSDEGRSMDEDEAEEFDDLASEMKDIDADLRRYRALEKARMTAKAIDGADDVRRSSRTRGGLSVQFGPDLPPGTRFARYAMAVAAGRGSKSDSLQYAERWKNQTPDVIEFIKNDGFIKADPGVTTDAGASPNSWAGDLTYPTNLASEFVGLLRPNTILGKLNGVRRVPFNIRITIQEGGSTIDWVGETAPKPVGENAFDSMTLGHHKVAGIIVMSEELVRLSSPSAEELVRTDLIEQTAKFLDEQFLNPAVAAVANLKPASVTNGVTGIPATGTAAVDLWSDINTALAAYDNTNLGTGSMAVLMPPAVARGIGSLRNLVGGAEFGVTPQGGDLNGFQVIVSTSVPAGNIIFIKADEILMADDGETRLDASNQATLNMVDVNPATAASFSLWQRNCIGLRAERWITWAKRRANAVTRITGAAYSP